LPQPDDLLALKAKHDLTTNDIASKCGVNPATARRWCKPRGRGWIPIPGELWDRLRQAVGEP